LEGYVAAKHLYFGRGAIQLSWNYNYIGASVALTGSADTFCDNPDVVATEGRYAWGAGIYFWMEHVKEESTSHIEALIDGGDFGGTLNNINGGLECPAHGGWHVDAVKARLNRYCRAAKVLGLPNLMRLDNCAGLQESLETCLGEGKCDDCHHYVGTSPGVVVDNYVPPASAPVSITVEVEPEAPVPLCPEGLMPWRETQIVAYLTRHLLVMVRVILKPHTIPLCVDMMVETVASRHVIKTLHLAVLPKKAVIWSVTGHLDSSVSIPLKERMSLILYYVM